MTIPHGVLNIGCHVGFEVFTAVVMKSIIFWDMTPCSLLSFNRCFGGTYRLHLQGLRSRFSKSASKQLATYLLAGLLNLLLQPWKWRRYVPPKRRLKLNGLHGVIFQKMILFIGCHIIANQDCLLKHYVVGVQCEINRIFDVLNQLRIKIELSCNSQSLQFISHTIFIRLDPMANTR
jgi:hypothetical protein